MKRMGTVESGSVESARKAKDKLHKSCQRVSEICEWTLHRQEQNRMHMASMREPGTFEQTVHALLHRGFSTSLPFIGQ